MNRVIALLPDLSFEMVRSCDVMFFRSTCHVIAHVLVAGQYSRMRSPLEWDIVLRNLVVMATMGCVFFLLTLLIECNVFSKLRRLTSRRAPAVDGVSKRDVNEDVDVTNERKRVLRGSGKKDVLRLENLSKVMFCI